MKEEAADIMSGGDHEVLVTGIGTLPAAIALTRRLSEGPLPSRVINVGTAGALVDLAPGVYEVSDAVKHDFKVGGTSEITDFVYPRWFTFEPLTELPKAKLATGELGVSDKVKIYGVDTSTADIQLMIEPDSAWVATAATNAAVVGEVAVRAVSLSIAGQDPGHSVLLQPTLVTRDDLVNNKIETIEDLQQKFPAFSASDAATASWIPAPKK